MVYATESKYQSGLANGCLLTWLMLLVPVAYGNWSAYKQWSNAKLLDRSGKIVQAEVVEAHTYRGSRVGTDYIVTYRLPAYLNPLRQTYRAKVNESVYFFANRFKKIEVKIIPDHPEIQKAEGSENPMFFVFLMAIINLVFLVGLVIFTLGA